MPIFMSSRKRIGTASFVLILMGGAGPAWPRGEAEIAREQQRENLDRLVAAPLRGLGETRAAVEARLGAPDRVETREIRNRHTPGVYDRILTLHYPGARVEILKVTQNDREALWSLAMTDDLFDTATGIGIGTSREAVIRHLGKRHPAGVDTMIYRVGNATGADYIWFHFMDGRVVKIEWAYFFD